jgi:hypothetical protein
MEPCERSLIAPAPPPPSVRSPPTESQTSSSKPKTSLRGSYGSQIISAAAETVEKEALAELTSEQLRRAVDELTDLCRAAIRSEESAAGARPVAQMSKAKVLLRA